MRYANQSLSGEKAPSVADDGGIPHGLRIVMVDNYDSFTYNLVQVRRTNRNPPFAFSMPFNVEGDKCEYPDSTWGSLGARSSSATTTRRIRRKYAAWIPPAS